MSSTFSAVSAASASDSSEPACEPSPSAKSTPTAEQFSLDIGQASPATETSSPLTEDGLWPTPTSDTSLRKGKYRQGGKGLGYSVSKSSAVAFPVRTSASPERVLVLQERGVGSGANTGDSLANFDPATSSWRTSQRCLVEGWSRFSETWPRSGMTRSGTAYRLPTLAPLTDATESGLLPTPEASNTKAVAMRTKGRPPRDFLKPLWPTPRESEYKGVGPLGSKSHKYMLERQYLGATVQEVGQVSGALNPTWVEWLMGFPLGWTVLEHWVTRSSRKSLKSSDAQS